MDSVRDVQCDAYENGVSGFADIRARKARTGDAEFANAVRRVILRRRIMVDHGHLGRDQRNRGERRDKRPRTRDFPENLHDRTGKYYPTATVATMLTAR